MQKYKKYLGLSVDAVVLTGIEKYYDLSTDQTEYAFNTNKGYGINCELFINKYL